MQWYSYKQWIILVISFVILSCASVDIFDSQDAEKEPKRLSQNDLRPFLQVTISGGVFRVPERLVVYPDGFAVVYEHKAYIEKRTMLTPARVKQIRELLINANILNSNSSPRQTQNSVSYEVLIANNSTTYFTISTENLLSQPIKDLIAGIDQIIEEVINDGLKIELIIPQYKTAGCDTLSLVLRVSNTTHQDIILRFPSAQEYDFYLYTDPFSNFPQNQWQWGEEKGFAQTEKCKTLPPQANIDYQANWKNQMSAVDGFSGTFYIRGMLLSTPGGTPREVAIMMQ